MDNLTISEIRKSAGLTQQDMADKLGISRQTYAKLENHPETATIMQAREICEILGEKYQHIFFGKFAT